MSKFPVPSRVDKAEVERICAMGPADSPVCQQQRERLAEWQEYEQMRDAESARLREARERQQEERRHERREAREAERAAEVAAVQKRLRHEFFTASPYASEADWLRLKDRIYDEHLLEQARRGRNPEVAALAERYGGQLL